VNPIRVLMANRPRLIRELVMGTISDQPDIQIVGEIQQDNELESAVERIHPDVLIAALERSNELSSVCHRILRNHPGMRVIAISQGGSSSMFYWASVHIESNSIETSEAGVLSAIRADTQPAERF
jgi:chemotaxis response regulator CheB